MRRRPDWRTHLRMYLEDVAAHPFRPGQHDCAMFVAGGIEAMTGEDPAADWRGAYRSLAKGRALITERGFEDMVDIAASQLDEVAPIFAREGDVAVLEDDEGLPAFGLVQGALIYVLRPDGLGLVALTEARRAFRI